MNKVQDVVDVVSKMKAPQHLIVASTSAISEGRMNASETDEVFVDKLDEYSLSMFQREKKLGEITGAAGYAGPLISMRWLLTELFFLRADFQLQLP